MNKITGIRKLVTFPAHVWEEIAQHVGIAYDLSVPKHNFSFDKFLYGKSFNYAAFVQNIKQHQARLLLSLLSNRLGVSFLRDSEGYKIVTLTKDADDTIEYCIKKAKNNVVRSESLIDKI